MHVDGLQISLNSPPTVSDVALADGSEDTSVTINVSDLLANATDVDNDALSVSGVAANHGTVVDNGDGTLTFTPDADYNGTVTFTYTVSDQFGASAAGSAHLDLSAVNDGPTVDGAVTLASGTEDVAVTISVSDLLANVFDVDGDDLSLAAISADHGTVSVNADGTVTFTPEADYNGEVTFTYTVSDGHGGVVTDSATMTLADVIDNANPDARDDSTIDTVAQAPSLSVDISDAVVSTTTTGTQWNNGANGAATPGDWSGLAAMGNPASSPTQNYSGWINGASGTGGNDSILVSGGLNGAVGLGSGDDALYVTGGANSGGNISAGDGNDTVRIDGDAQTVDLGAGNDKLELRSSMKGSIDAGVGDDQVKLFGTADQKIVLGGGNDQLDVGASLNSNGSVDAGAGDDLVKVGGDINAKVILGDGDDYLKVGGNQNSSGSIDAGAGDDVVKITGDANSKTLLGEGDDFLSVGGQLNGGATIDAGAGDDVVKLGKDINGKVLLGDGDDYLSATGYINGGGTVDAGAGDDYVQVGTTNQWNSGGKVDMGAGDDSLVYKGHIQTTLVGGAGEDSLVLSDYTKADWDADKDNIQSSIGDGKLISGFEKIALGDGTVLFDTTTGTTTSSYTYTITVTAAENDTDGSETLSSATISNIPAGAAVMVGGQVLTANADGSYTVPVSSGSGASVSVVSSTALDLSSVTTTVSSTEANGGATLTTSITGEGTASGDTVADEAIAVGEGGSLTLKASDLLANDTDADGDTLSITAVGNSDHGTVTLAADGTIQFVPDADYSGPATFEYTVSDGHGGTDTATVTVQVSAGNDAPVITGVSGGTGAESTTDAATTVTGRIGATDADGDPLTYALTDSGAPVNGTVEMAADGSYVYTANDPEWSGTDTFGVLVSDGQGGTATQVVTITVTPEADTPTLQVSASVSGNGITVTNMGHEEASYHNTYGYYILDDAGNPSTGQIIWGDVKDSIGDSFTVSGVNPERVGFFLIPNGDGSNCGKITNGESVSFTQDSSGNWQVIDQQGNRLVGASGANVVFDDASLNPGDTVMAQDNTDALGNQNWEDLTTGSDSDYDDANFNVQDATTGAGVNDTLTGTSNAETLKGLAGNDTLYGNGGNDVLYGDDTASTGAQVTGGYVYADLNIGYASPDDGETFTFTIGDLPGSVVLLVDGEAVSPVNGVYTLTEDQVSSLQLQIPENLSGVSLDFAVAITSHDGVSAATTSSTARLEVPSLAGDGNDYIDGGSGNDRIYGGGGNDNLLGGSGSDTILGGDGSDILTGGAGVDSLDGGVGNDTFVFTGEDGTDFSIGSSDYSTAADQGGANGSGGTGETVDISNHLSSGDTYVGGDGYDTLQMTDGNDFVHISNVSSVERINAGAGDDVIDMNYSDGGAYNSFTLDGGSGNDTVFANNGDDYLMGGAGNDFMSGNAGADTLDGGIGTDTIYGGSGDDTLDGGAGNDTLVGGEGNDTFLFDFGDGHDTVTGGNGSSWTDTVDLTSLGAGVTIDITTSNGDSWTMTTDNTEHILDLGDDKSGSVVVHHADGSSDQLDFHSLEQVKW